MSEAVNAVVETLVGFVCLGAGIAVWRKPGLRLLALVLAVAGLAAIGHAATAIAS
jgi:hypothetical protein